MLRIILDSYMVRYPLGGMMSFVLQYLVGFQRLEHEIYFVEKSAYPDSCFDPSRGIMSDDYSYGIAVVNALLKRFGLQERWCFVDISGNYHGLSRERIQGVFKSADLFVTMMPNSPWRDEAEHAALRVFVDQEPGYTQINMEKKLAAGEHLPKYDFYYSTGRNIGTKESTAPTAGKEWGTLFHPVVVDLFRFDMASNEAPFTTVMNWRSHAQIKFKGVAYCQKDVEFKKFMFLPGIVSQPMEIAVAGKSVPLKKLIKSGWRVRDAHKVTVSFNSFKDYIELSRGEFSVCKNAFVATNNGWFSDRSAAYLASGRPVVVQDTGFTPYLPCGEGLFAVQTAEEAAESIEAINEDYEHHAKSAREIAIKYLDAPKVLGRFLGELGL